MNYSKKHIAKALSKDLDVSLIDSKKIVDLFFLTQSNVLKKNKYVKISKFGSFRRYVAPTRVVRNISTMEEFELKKRNRIKFKSSNKVKNIFNS